MNMFENEFVSLLNSHFNQFSYSLSLETNLVDAGISSLDFVRLVVWIEEEFKIEFEDSHLSLEYFPTLQSLCVYVERLQSKSDETKEDKGENHVYSDLFNKTDV